MKLTIAITGATGFIYGQRLLEVLQKKQVETHLIVSRAGWQTAEVESDISKKALIAKASQYHSFKDIKASIASGSSLNDGMIIAPCSMNTLAEIANGISQNLIARAADVTLKERRKLVVLTRETPLTLTHIENMKKLSQMGAIIAPPVPAFYNKPQTIDDLVNHTVGRILDLFGIDANIVKRWQG